MRMSKTILFVAAVIILLFLAACSPDASELGVPTPGPTDAVADTDADTYLAEPDITSRNDEETEIIFSESGFDSPEGAVVAYLEGLRDSNLDRMLNAFGVEAYVRNFDFRADLEWARFYSPANVPMMPNANDFVTNLNIESYRASVIDAIITQYIHISFPELEMTRLEDDASIDDFVNQMNSRLDMPEIGTLEILGFLPLEELSELIPHERDQSRMDRQARILGADQVDGRIVVFEIDGRIYVLFAELVDYGGRWYIRGFGGYDAMRMGLAAYFQGLIQPEIVNEFMNEILAGRSMDSVLVPANRS